MDESRLSGVNPSRYYEDISCSLRVDTLSTYYETFVKPLRMKRKLSGFISALMEAYYDCPEMHELFYEWQNRNSDDALLSETIAKLNLQYQNQSARLNMLEQTVENGAEAILGTYTMQNPSNIMLSPEYKALEAKVTHMTNLVERLLLGDGVSAGMLNQGYGKLLESADIGQKVVEEDIDLTQVGKRRDYSEIQYTPEDFEGGQALTGVEVISEPEVVETSVEVPEPVVVEPVVKAPEVETPKAAVAVKPIKVPVPVAETSKAAVKETVANKKDDSDLPELRVKASDAFRRGFKSMTVKQNQ